MSSRIRHGLLMRVRTVVPFGRVQHIDTTQGPIERRLGLATADPAHRRNAKRGGGAARPARGGCGADADRIRAKIRQDLV